MAAAGSLQSQSAAVLVLTCLVLMPLTCGSTNSKRHVTQWCGEQLVQTLQLLCNGEYNQMFRRSRFNVDLNGEVHKYRSLVPLPLQRLTILHSRARLRVRRGVTDECCRIGCTLAVLQSYCAER